MLSKKTRDQILELQKAYPNKRSALIPALHLAQAECGYLPQDIQIEIAELFEIALNEVNGVVTFYDMFSEIPRGKHLIHVCKNISCMLRGADQLMSTLCQKLQIIPGGTTEDGEYTLLASECLGACDCAPVMLLDETIIGPVEPSQAENLIADTVKQAQNIEDGNYG